MIRIDPPATERPVTIGIVEKLRQNAQAAPDRLALVCEGDHLTWADFDARQNKVAQALIAHGVEKGDRIAVLSQNSIPYAEVFCGGLRAGACVTPLSSMAAPEALRKMLNDSGAKMLFVSAQYVHLVEEFIAELPLVRIAFDFARDGFEDYTAMVAAAPNRDPDITLVPEDAFNLIYSSGTTGTPKGIVQPHQMRIAQMERVSPSGYDAAARTLISTPMYSNTTLVAVFPTLYGGSTVYLMPKFDARRYLEIVEAERITHTMLVPVQYKRIMDVPDFDQFDLSSMQLKFSTSAPLRTDVKADVIARFPGRLVEYYGLTEGGVVTVLDTGAFPDKLHTVGKPAGRCEIVIIDSEGTPVPQGTVGEVCGRSPTMMAGYFGRDDLTADYIWRDAEGRAFFRSGDMGHVDEDGFLILSDRKKDMIISGGLNIYANDLELALLSDPDVSDAAVIGVPSEAWGETPLGLVVRRDSATRSAEDIRDSANAKLGKSQRLSAVELRESLPRSTIGKILKKELRAPYWDRQASKI